MEEKSVLERIKEVLPEGFNFDEVLSILSLSDESFDLFAPVLLDEIRKANNNTTDRLMMVEALKDLHIDADEIQAAFDEFCKAMDEENEFVSKRKRDFLKEVVAVFFGMVMEVKGDEKSIVMVAAELCREGAKLPSYANVGDAGADVYAVETIEILPGETKLVPTGLKVGVPKGFELQVRPKSGRCAQTKLRVANSPGTIDSLYRDEVCVIIENIEPKVTDISYSFDENGKIKIDSIKHGRSFIIEKGQKFAQLVLNQVPKAGFYQVENISEIEGNRGGGFGSSGLI